MKNQPTRRLVLHFNIDKTIVCKDPYNGLENIQITLADCVAKMSWGTLTVENNSKKWTLVHEQFSRESPEEGLITFSDYLEMEYEPKYKPDQGETVEQMEDYNQRVLEQKREKLLTFTKAGNPGSKFKSQVEKLNRATYLPK